MEAGRPWLRGPLVGIGVQAQFHTYTSAFTLNVGHSDTQGLEGTKCLVCLPIPPLREVILPASGGAVDFCTCNGF